jgi:hypothetical protein
MNLPLLTKSWEGTRMLTGEKFAHYLMKKEGFEKYAIKNSSFNSMFRYSRNGVPTVYLLKKHKAETVEAIDVAAHEVGHAVDLRKKEKYNVLMSYVYIYTFTNLIVLFFSYLFLIPAILFALICAVVYIKSELEADKNKRILIAKHIKGALEEHSVFRDPQSFMNEMEKNKKRERNQSYRLGILMFIVVPFILHFTEFVKG